MRTALTTSLTLLLAASTYGQESELQFTSFSSVEAVFSQQQEEIDRLRADLASIRSSQMYQSQPTCSSGNLCCEEPSGGKGYVLYENVIVKPFFTRNPAYYLDEPEVDGQVEVPFNWDMSYSPRIELGYNPGCDEIGARVRYWHFDDSTQIHAIDPDGNIAAWFADDSSNDIGFDNSDEALFSHSLQLDVIDLEAIFQKRVLTYSAGLRYARMEQEYQGIDLDGTDVFSARHDFEGVGLTAAAEIIKPLNYGVSVFAKGRGSLLYGESNFLATNEDLDAAIVGRNTDDILAISELQVGLDWRKCVCSGQVLFVTAAAEAQYWFNAGNGGPINNAVYDEGNYQNGSPQDSDMGFLGLTIGTGVEF